MSGQWPPEWEDPEEEYPGQDEQLDAEAEAQLSAVAAFLAALPAPAMPDAVEARISAALATEALAFAKDAGPAGPAGPADGSRKLDTSRPRPRAGRHRGGGGPGRDGTGPRRSFRVRPSTAAGSLVAILLVAGLGYGLSRANPSSSSSSAASGSAAVPAAGKVPSPAASSAAAAGSGAAGSEARPTEVVPRAEHTVSTFAVTVSGTKYEQATLAAQVRGRLATSGGQTNTFAGTFPSPTTSPQSSGTPSPALRGCVLHLTNGAPPRLVDRATYEGQQAYVIASSTQVWVAGLGCTAAKPELITSQPLAG